METKSWPLIVLSVVSFVVMGGSVAWAEATHAEPHVAAAPAEDDAEADAGGKPGFQVCAGGNFPAYVVLSETKAKTATAAPGKCVTATVDDAGETYEIQIFGLEGTTPFEIGEDEVTGDGTQKVTATGTVDNPDETTE